MSDFWDFLAAHGVSDTRGASSDVGKGWWPILADLFNRLRAAGWNGDVSQIKEKFGRLRVYLCEANKDWDRLVDEAELKSHWTCEDCGCPGKRRPTGWIRTLCDVCAVARERG